jgi:hypothetical protein
MCCFWTILVFLGPRAGILIWYLVNPARWALAFPQSWGAACGLHLGTLDHHDVCD